MDYFFVINETNFVTHLKDNRDKFNSNMFSIKTDEKLVVIKVKMLGLYLEIACGDFLHYYLTFILISEGAKIE